MTGTLVFIFAVLSTLISYHEADALRMFHGRPERGMIPLSPEREPFSGASNSSDLPPEEWFLQKLDHFNAADNRYWSQRFYTNSTLYKSGGPLFVLIGGEGELTGAWLIGGAWTHFARTYNAYCVQLEHRYYGKSHPTSNTSVKNMAFLSSEQALADLAMFITHLKQKFTFSKVIAFGGSYAGSLAAWLRLKYPHLVYAAVASSAPVFPEINFKEYLEVVDSSMKYYDPSGACNSAISTITSYINGNLTTAEGRQNLKKLFNLCDEIDATNKNDISRLFTSLAENIKGIVQYNLENVLSINSNLTVKSMCDILTDASTGDPLQGYAQINGIILEAQSQDCLDYVYDNFIDSAKNESWDSSAANGTRQWTYQSCTEFGFYQSSDSNNQPFGHEFPIDFWTQQCADIFGADFNISLNEAAVRQNIMDYGALDIKVTRVIFVNGDIDPWHVQGVLQDLGPDARAFFMTGTAHVADMYTTHEQDLPQIAHVRSQISDIIGAWLRS